MMRVVNSRQQPSAQFFAALLSSPFDLLANQNGFKTYCFISKYDLGVFVPICVYAANTSQTPNTIWSTVVAILFVGAICGSIALRIVAEKAGRKSGLLISFTISLISIGLAIISHFIRSFELYSVSRVTLGFSLGLSLGLSALYLSESSPKQCRGFVSMMTGTIVQFGTVVGSIVAMPTLLGTEASWWIIYAIEAGILLIALIAMPFMHDSPGYLALIGENAKARESIRFFHKCSDDEIDAVLTEIKDNLKQNAKSIGMFDVHKDKHVLRGTVVGSMVAFAMAFSGIAVINAFAVELLKSCGLSVQSASIANVGLSTVSLIAIIGSAFIVDHFGRRPLILIANAAILFLNVAIFGFMFAFEQYGHNWLGYCLIAVIATFILFFAIGPGPLCYFITAEMVGQNARSAGQSWASLVQMTSRSLLLAIYLPMKNAIGSPFSYLILFVAPILFSLVFFYFMLPETKNRNMKEVHEEVERLPTLTHCLGQSRRSRKQSVDTVTTESIKV
uniref:MFS domain-containing protein n=1 Tax=Steinernema glaseri TaxID=37863 RepID=A0A1I7ZAR1_9BILA